MKVLIHTDGSCRSKGGSFGGWAAILRTEDGYGKEISGSETPSTNNRMELLAAIKALESLKYPCDVVLTTDSEYVKNGITLWIQGWKQNGWRTKDKKPVTNQDLWERLEAATLPHRIEWKHVRGHQNDFWNNRCDKLATAASEEARTAATVLEKELA